MKKEWKINNHLKTKNYRERFTYPVVGLRDIRRNSD